ncbi:hypothetical protein HDU98_001718, partial [Podochytrium sp. JEL0797]
MVDSQVNLVDVKVVTDVNGAVLPFFLTNTDTLSYGTTYTPLMSAVSNIQPIFDVTNTILSVFAINANQYVQYMTRVNGVWSSVVVIPGQLVTSFSVVARNDGSWDIYVLNTNTGISYTAPQTINVANNCLDSTYANQNVCPAALASSSVLSSSLSSSIGATSSAVTSASITSAAVTSIAPSSAAPSVAATSAAATSDAATSVTTVSAVVTSSAAPVAPNADCMTITQAFFSVQFNIDCYNISPNGTYPVGAPSQRRRASTDYLAFQKGRLIHVILPNMGLQGTIPAMLGNLGQLMILDLSGNSLVGAIPPQLASCTNLQQIDLQNNLLTGVVPPVLMQLLAANGAIPNFGTNCLGNANNQRTSCHKQGINCLDVSLDNEYTGPAYQPLWAALATSGNDLNAFDEVAAGKG